MTELVRTASEGDVGFVTIDRPEKLNALNSEVNDQLQAAFRTLENAVVIVLSSAGERAFVAGADLDEIHDQSMREFVDFQKRGRATNDSIESHPAIVIAAVNGLAYGGGFELALASDMIVAGEGAEFAVPEVKLGLVPGGGGTQRLPRKIGTNKAKELLATGEPMTAKTAERLGLVNEVVADDEVDEAARDLAETIATNAPLAVREAKRLPDEGRQVPLETALSYEQEVTFTLYESDDAKEGIGAFVEKREPEFSGE